MKLINSKFFILFLTLLTSMELANAASKSGKPFGTLWDDAYTEFISTEENDHNLVVDWSDETTTEAASFKGLELRQLTDISPTGYNDKITDELLQETAEKIKTAYSRKFAEKGLYLTIYAKLKTSIPFRVSSRIDDNRFSMTLTGLLNGYVTDENALNADGLLGMACFAVGQGLAGAPLRTETYYEGMSNPGQADYFVTLKCLRQFWRGEDNSLWVSQNEVDQIVVESCKAVYSDLEKAHLCMRVAMAGKNMFYFAFSFSSTLYDPSKYPSFATPSNLIVDETFHSLMDLQCRLDTVLQGALCDNNIDEDLDDNDPSIGTCYPTGVGARPRCWFNPN